MNWIVTIYIALLFFVLTPGVLVSLPPKKGKFTVAAVHALIFALIWHFTHKFVWNTSMMIMMVGHEGLENEEKMDKKEKKSEAIDDDEMKKQMEAAIAAATKAINSAK